MLTLVLGVGVFSLLPSKTFSLRSGHDESLVRCERHAVQKVDLVEGIAARLHLHKEIVNHRHMS